MTMLIKKNNCSYVLGFLKHLYLDICSVWLKCDDSENRCQGTGVWENPKHSCNYFF